MGSILLKSCLDHCCCLVLFCQRFPSHFSTISCLYGNGSTFHPHKHLPFHISFHRGPEPTLDYGCSTSNLRHLFSDSIPSKGTLNDNSRVVLQLQHLKAAPLCMTSVLGLNEQSASLHLSVLTETHLHSIPRLNPYSGSSFFSHFSLVPFLKRSLYHFGSAVFLFCFLGFPSSVPSLYCHHCSAKGEIMSPISSCKSPCSRVLLNDCCRPVDSSISRGCPPHSPLCLDNNSVVSEALVSPHGRKHPPLRL